MRQRRFCAALRNKPIAPRPPTLAKRRVCCGTVLPVHRNDVGVRAAHRAAATATTLHDCSYDMPLQLSSGVPAQAGQSGSRARLWELLGRCGWPAGREPSDGLRLDRFTLRWPGTPGAAIAPAEVLQLPVDGRQPALAQLWLWVPIAAAAEAQRCLRDTAAAMSEAGSADVVAVAERSLSFNCFELCGAGAATLLASVLDGGIPTLAENEALPAAASWAAERAATTDAGPAAEEGAAATPAAPTTQQAVDVLLQPAAAAEAPATRATVLVIRRPALFGVGAAGCASWDILAPRGCGMALWQCLVLRGARAIGLVEREHIRYEAALPCFPRDYPDAGAYRLFAQEAAETAQQIEARLPPRQRRSHVAAEQLGVQVRSTTGFRGPAQGISKQELLAAATRQRPRAGHDG